MTKDERELFRMYLKKEIAQFLNKNGDRFLKEFGSRYNIDVTTAKEDKNAPVSNANGNAQEVTES